MTFVLQLIRNRKKINKKSEEFMTGVFGITILVIGLILTIFSKGSIKFS